MCIMLIKFIALNAHHKIPYQQLLSNDHTLCPAYILVLNFHVGKNSLIDDFSNRPFNISELLKSCKPSEQNTKSHYFEPQKTKPWMSMGLIVHNLLKSLIDQLN